jgi:hypothetical protein
MSKPKVFVGSSKENLRTAKVLAKGLQEEADVEAIVWNEGVFSLNRGILEDLFAQLDQFDFAVLVWAPDDMTASRDDLSPSTRDNVLFECGLFMGRFGRNRVFIAHDDSIPLKIPSDFAGVTLAPYNGQRVLASTPAAAMREACRLISEAIKRPLFVNIVGEWRSRYMLTSEKGHPLVEDDVEITPSQGGVCIANKNNSLGDSYTGQANLTEQRFLTGKWRATASSGSMNGVFMLTVNPPATIMYGYCSGVDETSGAVYGTWVLAKKDGNEAQIAEHLHRGEEFLKHTFMTWQLPSKTTLGIS